MLSFIRKTEFPAKFWLAISEYGASEPVFLLSIYDSNESISFVHRKFNIIVLKFWNISDIYR
jgi:hypothetical protein